ncbi:hypothetical protein HY493_03270 [Candidatus Woesearchaeota archaeon]|nr:hypothetical protein [Candidatus Woesearchaeota archaeon]
MTDPQKQEPSIKSLHAEFNHTYAPRVKGLYGMPRAQMELQLETIFGEFERSPFYQTMLTKLGENLAKSTFMTIKGNECDKAREHAMVEGIDATLARAFGETNFAELQKIRELADAAPQAAKEELKKLFMDKFAQSPEYKSVLKADPAHTQPACQTFYQAAKAFVTGESETNLIPYISAARVITHPEPVTVPEVVAQAAQGLEQRVGSENTTTQVDDILNAILPEDSKDALVTYRAKLEPLEQSLATAAEALGQPGAPGFHEDPAQRKGPFYEKVVLPLLDSPEMRDFYKADAVVARDFAAAKISGLANIAGITLTDDEMKAYALYLDVTPKTEAPKMPQTAATDSDPIDLSTGAPAQETGGAGTPAVESKDAPAEPVHSAPASPGTPVEPSTGVAQTQHQGSQHPSMPHSWFSEAGCGKMVAGIGLIAAAALGIYVMTKDGCDKKAKPIHKPDAGAVIPVDEGSLEDQVLNSVFAGKYAPAREKFSKLTQTDESYKSLAARLGWNGKSFDDAKFNAAEAALPNVAQASYDVLDDTVGETKKGVDPVAFEIEFRKLESELLAMTQRDKLTEEQRKAIRQLALARLIEQIPKLEE